MTIANNQQDLKNAQSTFNATVPVDAPIMPPQAFVDVAKVLLSSNIIGTVGAFPCPNLGITSIQSNLWTAWNNNNGLPSIDLSGNALDAASVNGLLAVYAAHFGNAIGDTIIDLSGVNMATPTGGLANADLVTLGNAGWTGFINIGGVQTAFP